MVSFAVALLLPAAACLAQPASAASAAARWVPVPKVDGRLSAADIGLLINSADPYSVAVGEYYAQRRALSPRQVLRLVLPVKPVLTAAEFDSLQAQVQGHFGSQTQALALAWREPYAVACNSITAALTLGFDAAVCNNTCAPTRASPYANSATSRPWAELGLRPSMLLAARDETAARRLIDRGVASDGTLGRRGAPPAQALFLGTGDASRNVRMRLYPPSALPSRSGVRIQREAADELHGAERVLIVQTGSARIDALPALQWLDGGLGDHLTSYGGVLGRDTGQSTALDWIDAGATASYGTVSEPCNHLQKFPHPQWLLLHYLQGSTAIEAYWKSVAWPQQGLFIGEPLAAPFARRRLR